MLLAIDTSGATSVAVVDDDGALVASLLDEDVRAHAEHIGPLLETVLERAGRPHVDAVAYGVGPGPFTGLRVGMAAARTAALVLGAIELPVLSHDAVALEALRRGMRPAFAVVADAKRRERFATVYRGLDAAGMPARDGEPAVGPETDLPRVPHVIGAVDAGLLGVVAALRRAHGVPPEAPDARYLRSPDVTIATVRKSVLG
ncbi:tRNA (adenosine(37)-N6)-threonylcarbamoyltransferase complex dimerization subunit type 1 TsaB [Amnibacterium setariae]|uniref:tRNA (Adenosine(37)-N6)-threonylcarbamoyltransferase complex dimerization subunit type 1 TsaB n=1 Tax=Amnibacterium setariae TaxID=2306585 RepID=A0A3A1U4J4_9MICO|nr:tRNA (adenosine(37)-N6)-threonylcarbamoyltransferase complex dimerization subunit type 1 TsaB [Amnibacterium setariae]RIX30367.1 tRNA (adenosine(37)-N6)-threonylcarbamoyltransferase complex dimerization subunit type 1 TsaB [Amnibacterium setariae]